MGKVIFQIIMVWGGVLGLFFSNSTPTQEEYQQKLHTAHSFQNEHIAEDTLQGADTLFSILTHDVFPAWYGTSWDFNGVSNIPGQGEIACGYFVSTTLKHIGFNLNRYTLAQQASASIVTEVCAPQYTQKISGYDHLSKLLAAQSDGVFIIGLDYHVGFIVIEDEKAFFVHSDYFSGEVIREKASTSESLQASQNFVLGELTHNPELMYKWHRKLKIF